MKLQEDLIAARPAPVPAAGFAGRLARLRKQGPIHAALSFLSYAVMALMIFVIVRWGWSSTWGATSVAECRAILDEVHGKACWGVIRERWTQLSVGFYPRDALWRPILAVLLLAPSIFVILNINGSNGLRKWALIPFAITPYLLWGGPVIIWIVILGFGFALIALIGITRTSSLPVRATILAAAIALFAILWGNLDLIVSQQWAQAGLSPVTSREFGGFLLSILIGLAAILFSLPLGVALALGRTSSLPLFRVVSTGFIEFIRGVPLITLLFIASTLLNIFLPPGSSFDIVLRVIIMVTLFSAAYVAEVIRGALSAVPKGQTEGAASLGLNYWQTQRLIILPQALKISIPGIVSTFIAVFKDTTLVSIIGLLDPIGLANNIRADSAWTGIVWEIYGFAAVIFFILCFAMSQYSLWLERQLKTDHH